jgi:RNA polymerase sigma-70 factor, ECF subfamily
VKFVTGAVRDDAGLIKPTGPISGAVVGPAREIEEPGRLLEGCQQYLLMIANDVIGPELQAKLGASDLVQDTFLEAQRHMAAFRGRTKAELRVWLRTILERRLANIRRSYLTTEKRDATREMRLDPFPDGSDGKLQAPASRSLSPSSHAVRNEWAQALGDALVRMPEHYRQVVAWRHHDQLPWDEIGRRMSCTADAARKVWSRAIQQLRRELGEHGSMA